ncbi:MAG: type II secretion system protein GspC [Kofleriaceae bacterium]
MRSTMVVAVLVSSSGVARAEDQDALYACKVPAPGTKLTASFKPEVSLQHLATWVTGFTCKNIVFSADVAKRATRVTIISPGKMTPKQALQLFVDAVEATGLAVQVKPDTIIIKLGPNMPKNCPDTTVSSSSPGEVLTPWPGDLPAPAEASDDDITASIDKGIKKINPTTYEITAELVDKIVANPMAVSKGVRVVPSVKDGAPNGFKLYAIRPSSLYAKLGFENGDTLLGINGMSLDSADKALEVYTKVREAKTIDVSILRRGKPVTLSIKIKR